MAPVNSLSALPAELLDAIGQVTRDSDLPSLLLGCKAINHALTPLLYASITPNGFATMQKCADTLAQDPADHYDERDLATFVRSFIVQVQVFKSKRELRARLARSLEGALVRMLGLRHFVLDSSHLGTPKMCIALARGPARTLRTLVFRCEDEGRWPDESDPNALDGLRPDFPELTSIALSLNDFHLPAWFAFFQHMLTSRAGHLRTLSLNNLDVLTLQPFFLNPGAWSALEELTLNMQRPCISLADLPHAPSVRKLTLDTEFRVPGDPWLTAEIPGSIPEHLCPNLEHLACPYQLLPLFLPANAQKPRPIRTVRLNHAYFDPGGEAEDSFTMYAPAWEDVREALSTLPRSAGPVVDLAFYIYNFDAVTFAAEIVDYVKTLERLVIVLYADPRNVRHLSNFGEQLFAHMPALRSFFLSDAPTRVADEPPAPFFAFHKEIQRQFLEEWDKHTSVLTEVALTTVFVWRKLDGGWTLESYIKDVRAYTEWCQCVRIS
ncbi:hypothetical protein GY45DRAFT_1316396 [Cubamyces sp. BRFM 1775]|nr:hypothetical protein GY45DRAFT_1316396 [Cubamyces sp. BRFM 1775]